MSSLPSSSPKSRHWRDWAGSRDKGAVLPLGKSAAEATETEQARSCGPMDKYGYKLYLLSILIKGKLMSYLSDWAGIRDKGEC